MWTYREVALRGAAYLWPLCRSTRVFCHRAVEQECWSGRCTRHIPSGRPPRFYRQRRTSKPAEMHHTKPSQRAPSDSAGHQLALWTYIVTIRPLPHPRLFRISLIQTHPEPATLCSERKKKRSRAQNKLQHRSSWAHLWPFKSLQHKSN